MAPILAEVGATIVGAVPPNTTLDELKPKPDKVGVIMPLLITMLSIFVEPWETTTVANVVPPPELLFIVTT